MVKHKLLMAEEHDMHHLSEYCGCAMLSSSIVRWGTSTQHFATSILSEMNASMPFSPSEWYQAFSSISHLMYSSVVVQINSECVFL
jgi:hypothetical protein